MWAESPPSANPVIAGSVGPDVAVISLQNLANWGSEDPGSTGNQIAAFSVGTTSCNFGDTNLSWVHDTPEHPVIRSGMFRLLGGRFEQIGTSWVSHGFFAVNENNCGGGCIDPNTGFQLGPNCSDSHSASINGNRNFLGPTSEINAFTGQFPYPPNLPTGTGAIANRLQVRHSDLDPALNGGAMYFVDGHYIHPDDAALGNSENNASHRRVIVQSLGCPLPFCVHVAGGSSTQIGRPAIRAWKDNDPTVRETDALVPGEGMFILATKASDLGTGFWRYEYALYNMNSHRSARSFRVLIPKGSIVANAGFHDVHHHSGDQWKSDDWDVTVSELFIEWTTTPYDEDTQANALRWSTLYNFRFDVNVPPEDSAVVVGLFRPGVPEVISIRTDAPQSSFLDCNLNAVPDHCDIDCSPSGCDAFEECGQSTDCDGSGVPDHPLCKPDCLDNGTPDACDILFCPPDETWCGDCNHNGVPDGCEPDCDGDGVIDDCEETLDTDGDGVSDCNDGCPLDPDKTKPGLCGCGESDVDSDGDSVPDCIDQCPGFNDLTDLDNDGVPDCLQFAPIPTTTAWGLAVLALMLLIGAKIRTWPKTSIA